MADVEVGVSLEEISVGVALEQVSVEVQLAGPAGPAGPIATGTGDAHFQQAFTPASSVTVTHNLGKHPAVTVIDSAGDEIEGDVQHTSINALIVTFSAPFSGTVFCN